MKRKDYIYSTPMFIIAKNNYGMDMDVFISCYRVDEENNPIHYPEEIGTTIREYYEAIDDLNIEPMRIGDSD